MRKPAHRNTSTFTQQTCCQLPQHISGPSGPQSCKSAINMGNLVMIMWISWYGSIPINTIFSGMNIYLPAILMFTRGTRFWHTAICGYDDQKLNAQELGSSYLYPYPSIYLIWIDAWFFAPYPCICRDKPPKVEQNLTGWSQLQTLWVAISLCPFS